MMVLFPVSGVETYLFVPFLVAFFLAYAGSMGGVTGAFLLLPFQMSVLGYVAPGVSATNFVYNVVAIPGIVARYIKERRMNWPLALTIASGSFPGIAAGYLLRVRYLSDPGSFKPFAGLVLLYMALLMVRDLLGNREKRRLPAFGASIAVVGVSITKISYEFGDSSYSFDPRRVFAVSLLVGIAGGAYGIGGGAVLAPFCISVLRLPVHTVAGASLFGTLISSIAGVVVYHTGFLSGGLVTRPDYLLGTLFGLGGALGGYLGAKTQKHVPEKPIKVGLFLVLAYVSGSYLLKFFQ